MIKWSRDLCLEDEFKREGMKFEWHDNIKMDSVDIEGSLANNARLGKQLYPEDVIKLMIVIESGRSSITGPVFRKRPGKTLLTIMAGNHRANAANEMELSTIGGYIVTCDDKQANIFIRSDNRKGARLQSDEEADEHIFYLNQAHGLSLAEGARRFGRPPATVQTQIRARKCRTGLEKSGINTDNLGSAVLIKLYQLRHNDDIYIRAASLASIYDMKQVDVDAMVTQVSSQRSQLKQAAALDVIEKNIQRNVPATPAKRQTPTKSKLLNLLSARPGGLLKVLLTGNSGKPVEHINEIGFTVDDAQQFIDLWSQANKLVTPLLTESRDWIKQQEAGIRHTKTKATRTAKAKATRTAKAKATKKAPPRKKRR